MKKKRLFIFLLSLVMVTSLLPGMMQTARADGKTISGLGTEAISNPTAGTDTSTSWQGSYVYYGGANPLKYRVLSKKTSDFSGTTMLLDCDSILQDLPFDSESPYSNVWNDSTIKTWLNGEDFLGARFTAAEKAAIAASIKKNPAEGDGNGWSSLDFAKLGEDSQNPDYIFLLDAKEATRPDYGFRNSDSSSKTREKTGGSYNWWWLRSPHSYIDYYAGFVDGDGLLDSPYVNHERVGVSPALNINLSSVIFTSLIESDTYKLTVRDSNITITPGTVSRNGSTITVPHTLGGTNKGNVTQVSVVMTDGSWDNTDGWSEGAAVKYYYLLDSDHSFTLPDDYDSSWKTYIIAEDVNAGTATDYAGAPVEITVPHAHVFTYTASGSTVTARCTAGCPDGYDTTGITLTLKAPTNLKYDGNAKEATIDGYPATAPAGLAAKPAKVTYYKSTGAGSTTTSGSALSGAPSGCGNYVAQMTWGGATASLPFSITSDAISFNVTFRVVNGGWNKTGSSDPIVVTLSRAENEDKLLKLEAGDIPAAGSRPSKGYMEGSWNDPAPSTETVISENKEYTYTYAAKGTDSLPVTQAGAVYGGTLEDPAYKRPTGTTKDPVITYTGTLWDGSAYGPSAAKPTETGSYTVSVTEETADKIYTGSADFAITPKSITGATIKLSASQLEYSGSEQSVTVDSVKLDGAVLKETDYTVSGQTKGTFKGTYTVTVTGKGNYKDSESVTWEIVDKSMTVSAPDVSFSYDGNAHGITVSVTDPAGGYTVKYGTEKGTYDLDASPTITNVKEGPKPIYFRVTADNYTAFTGSATVTITKATQAAPAAPTAEEVTENSVTLKVTDGYQYSMDGTNWQDSPVFAGLSKGTEYTFYQRIAGDDNHEPSPAGPGTAVTTAGVVYTVTNVEGGEHYIGNGEDAVITVKCNVDDAHTYNRYTGTKVDGKAVSEASLSTAPGSLVLTLKASYLDKLSIGEHQVTIAFTDGEAETTVTIKDVPPTPPPEPSASPEPTWVPPTGDTANFPLWIGLILLGLTGISVLGLTAPKHRK